MSRMALPWIGWHSPKISSSVSAVMSMGMASVSGRSSPSTQCANLSQLRQSLVSRIRSPLGCVSSSPGEAASLLRGVPLRTNEHRRCGR